MSEGGVGSGQCGSVDTFNLTSKYLPRHSGVGNHFRWGEGMCVCACSYVCVCMCKCGCVCVCVFKCVSVCKCGCVVVSVCVQ